MMNNQLAALRAELAAARRRLRSNPTDMERARLVGYIQGLMLAMKVVRDWGV